jgi:hypothetical protein
VQNTLLPANANARTHIEDRTSIGATPLLSHTATARSVSQYVPHPTNTGMRRRWVAFARMVLGMLAPTDLHEAPKARRPRSTTRSMHLHQIALLALVQGAAELLPVSSSAQVIMAGKWMGLDATSSEMTSLLVMLHTGTMFAVIVYLWSSWRDTFFRSRAGFRDAALRIVVAARAYFGPS